MVLNLLVSKFLENKFDINYLTIYKDYLIRAELSQVTVLSSRLTLSHN